MKTKNLSLGEIIVVAVLAIISVFIGLLPTIYRFEKTPADRVFVGTEFYSDDYSIYVSNIFQGQNGRWTLLDKHTSEPHQGTIIHNEYLLWGKLTKLLNIDQIVSYHLARVIFGFIFLFVAYMFLFFILPSTPTIRILTFIYLTASGGFPIINNNPDYMSKFHFSWLSEIDLVNRTTVLPHYLLGYIFFLLSALFFLKIQFSSPNKRKYLFFFCISGVFLGLIHPVGLIIFYCTILIYFIIFSVNKLVLNHTKDIINPILYIIKQLLYIIIFLFITSLVLVYYRLQFNVLPWTHMQQWENITDYHPDLRFLTDYLLAIGPTFFLSILGMLSIFKNQKIINLTSPVKIFFLSWLFSFFLLVFFSYPYLKISQVRLLQNPVFFPFSLLAAFGTVYLINLLFHELKVFLFPKSPPPKRLLYPFLICLIIFLSLPTAFYSLQAKFSTYKDFSTLIYPTKEQIAGINWLKNNTPKDHVVLALYEVATLIPFWSGNTIYAGHLWATLNWPEKSRMAVYFYSGKMSETEAVNFLKTNRISYVYFGFQEQSIGGNIEKYPFLEVIYHNPLVKIYKFTR